MKCPKCGTEMTVSKSGWICAECGHLENSADAAKQAEKNIGSSHDNSSAGANHDVSKVASSQLEKPPVASGNDAPSYTRGAIIPDKPTAQTVRLSWLGSAEKYIPQKLKAAIIVAVLTGSALLVLSSNLFGFGGSTGVGATPGFFVFLLAGCIGVGITAALFSLISKLGLGFSKSALALGFGYNAMIVIVKLLLAPFALYLTNQNTQFDTGSGDPNTPGYYLILGVIVLLLYVGVLRLTYGKFKRSFYQKTGIEKNKSKPFNIGRLVVWLILGAITLFFGGGAILFFGGFPLLAYLSYIFSGAGIMIIFALVAAYVLAYKTYSEVEKQAVEMRDATVLASFFWIGLSLIFLYHVLWIVFMVTLVSIWPFSTYTPK